jgi:protocatechuate 3,4-dioxygenase, alpha subunit
VSGQAADSAVAGSRVTPSQTVGPFLAIGLPWPDGPFAVPEGTPGAILIAGRVLDGAGDPVTDALVETWQADPEGLFDHPDDPRGRVAAPVAGFRGFGRCATDAAGEYRIVTLRPGPLPGPDGGFEAPHLDVSVFARGLLDRVVTRIYFPDEAQANAADPLLAAIDDPRRRATLIASTRPAGQAGDARWDGDGRASDGRWDGDGRASDGRASEFRFDIRLQGEHETVFFDV